MKKRKNKNSGKRESNRIVFYLNDVEHALFNKMFESSLHKEKSPFIREVLLEGKYEITYRDRSREDQIIALSKIGSNVNQIAHRLNMDNAPRLTEKDHAVLAEFKELFLNFRY